MEKAEIVKKIETNIEKVLEDFTEALQYLKTDGCFDECEELQNLFFANRRIIELIDSCLEIYHYLIRLKYLKNGNKPEIREERRACIGFKRLFSQLDPAID